jgi:hypothetical protein
MGDLKPLLGEVAGGTRDWASRNLCFLGRSFVFIFPFFNFFVGF